MVFFMKNTYTFFILLIFSYIFLNEVIEYIVDFDDLIYNSLSTNLTSNQINDFFNLRDKWGWINFLIVPIYLFFKTIIISSSVYVGIFFFGKSEITFNSILNITIRAEFIFTLVGILKIIWFYFFETNYTLEDIQCFYPLSAINITGYKEIEPWLIYPLQTLNLFELAYVIYLAYQIGYITKTNPDNGLKIICYSYVPIMFLWVIIIMFFTLNYS